MCRKILLRQYPSSPRKEKSEYEREEKRETTWDFTGQEKHTSPGQLFNRVAARDPSSPDSTEEKRITPAKCHRKFEIKRKTEKKTVRREQSESQIEGKEKQNG